MRMRWHLEYVTGGRMHGVSLSVGFGTEKKVEWFLVGRIELKNTRS